uniref:Ycf36 n=1 Tax=Pleonosporium borreri TaxID=2575635 RepID=A0A4D6WWR9_9FLOR|nr:hypothetical protein [Pleonosporium borreri]
MFFSKNECPVPFDQQPFNEYISLKKSSLFKFSTYSVRKYITIIFRVFLCLFILLGFCIYFVFIKINIKNILFIDNLILNSFFLLIFIRLYLGWSYVFKRLLSASIFYEESGWYDGQIWIKGADSLIKDRFIGIYNVLPIIKKVKYSLVICFINYIFNYLLYYFL